METKTIAFDFGATSGYEKIENGLSGLSIGVLGMLQCFVQKLWISDFSF